MAFYLTQIIDMPSMELAHYNFFCELLHRSHKLIHLKLEICDFRLYPYERNVMGEISIAKAWEVSGQQRSKFAAGNTYFMLSLIIPPFENNFILANLLLVFGNDESSYFLDAANEDGIP